MIEKFRNLFVLLCLVLVLFGCAENSDNLLGECSEKADQQLKNVCFRDLAYELKDEGICENIVEDFSHLTEFERDNIDANVSIKIDCLSGVSLAKYFSPENCEQIEYEEERQRCFDGMLE